MSNSQPKNPCECDELALKKAALCYHEGGKLATAIRTSMAQPHDLSLAYSPGVAEPCLAIAADPAKAYCYTSKRNLVAVVSDGSAVLGLGNIGALASKPVMEGKACLFKKFADVDAFDIELDCHSVEEIVAAVRAIAPSFGGVNLEDIAAPKCFAIEAALQDLGIPVMHDDQHGTAIISTAAIINASKLTGKEIAALKVVVCGAGAAGIASAKMYRALGISDITMLDSKGVICTARQDLSEHKREFARDTAAHTLEEAIEGADVFLGLSGPGVLTREMVAKMAPSPIIFALANPTPEIYPHEALAVRPDAIVATGRSDFANQINNVLGFPFIFRGALDVRARAISENMKMAAALALADLAQKPITEQLRAAYPGEKLAFGPQMIIPKPFDARVKAYVSTAVARAAVEDGIAGVSDFNALEYFERLLAE